MSSNRFSYIEIEALAELPSAVKRLATVIRTPVIPSQEASGRSWSEIRIELWADSGRIIAFPARVPFQERTDVAGCQISCTELAGKISELDDSDLTDHEFEIRFNQIEARVARIVRDGVSGAFTAFSLRDPDDREL